MKLLLSILLFHLFSFAGAQSPTWRWANSGRGAGHDYGTSISSDSESNCYATGYFQFPGLVFGNDSLPVTTPPNSDDFFLVKYDSSGNKLWARTAGGQHRAHGSCINTDSVGNSYVTGWFLGTSMMFPNYILTPTIIGHKEAFLAKYNSLGDIIWARSLGPLNFMTSEVYNSIDGNGYIYSTAAVDDTTMFIKKIDIHGNQIWQRSIRTTGNMSHYNIPRICADEKGNSYITGCLIFTNMIFGTTTITNNSNSLLLYIAKYDSSGNILWAKTDGLSGAIYQPSISSDANGNTYVAGVFRQSQVNFGNIILTNNDNLHSDFFIVKYDPSGNVVWARNGAGPDFDIANSIKTDKDGNSYLTGFYRGNATFGSIPISGDGSPDAFIAKYDSSGNAVWVRIATGINVEAGEDISLAPNGDLYITGQFSSPHMLFSNDVALTNCDTTLNPYEIYIAKLKTNFKPPAVSSDSKCKIDIETKIFPNPFITTLHINKNITECKVFINFYNSIGQTIFKGRQIFDGHNEIRLSNISSGIYFYRFYSGNKVLLTGSVLKY